MINSQSREELEKALPPRIGRLWELANNLWWSWHEDGRQVFRSLDYALWRTGGHNPVKQLLDISRDKLESASRDPAFLELYDSVMQKYDADISGQGPGYSHEYAAKLPGQIAYFSAEYAIHGSLPIYAGGLGVLAGDICKESSDMGLPLVAVGFMYPQGYFSQHISVEGWQQEVYTQLNFNEVPISPAAWLEGSGPFVSISIAGRELYLKIWQVNIGRVKLYLLDTDVDRNNPADRALSARLYTADAEERIRQLIVLGIGGVRVLRSLGKNPVVWHANEDHTVFMLLERLKEEITKGESIQSAIENVRAASVFTTHTPIPAGHNIFSVSLLEKYSANLWEALRMEKDTFLALGRYPGLEPGRFSLTAAALRLSAHANAVSRVHGVVARKMWHILWPERPEDEVPIIAVTNGVHVPTWQAPEIRQLCRDYLPGEALQNPANAVFWECAADIPDEKLWEIHLNLKLKLIQFIQERVQHRWVENGVQPQQVAAMGALLDPYALTIAFTRRFTEYKRPHLILTNTERLKKILTNPFRPVQIVFAGKSHPADFGSKNLLHQVYQLAMDRSFQGRIAFVEDYDLHISRDLVRGADVWLNNPRRLQEACGTSGMKASLNGIINLSIGDGWWLEGYNGTNGWLINDFKGGTPAEEDRADAESLYRLLEDEIVPLFYDRDRAGVPHRWVKTAREAIRSISPAFNARRMMQDYTRLMYLPAVSSKVAP